MDDIFAVRYIQDWNTHIGKRDCIVAATKTGLVMFWDALTKEYIQGLEIGSNICEIEFHPTKSLMLTVGKYWIGCELKIWKFDKYWSIIRIDIEVLGFTQRTQMFIFFHHLTQGKYQKYMFVIMIYRYIKSQKSQMIFTFLLKGMHQTLDT